MKFAVAKSVLTIIFTLVLVAVGTAQTCDLTAKNATLLLNLPIGMSPEQTQTVFGKALKIKIKKKGERTFFQNYIKKPAPESLRGVRALYLRFYDGKLYQIEIFYELRADLNTLESVTNQLAAQFNFPNTGWQIKNNLAEIRCGEISLVTDYILNPRIELTDETIRAKVYSGAEKIRRNICPKSHYRACNLCEAICGIEIEHENGEILSIKGDKLDPFSRGHVCPKAVALKDVYEDANRLKSPVKRFGDEWREISWAEAFDETARRIKEIQAKHGRNAVAVYQGNPSVHNFGTLLNSGDLLKTLKTQNNFSATSVDQLPHHFAAWTMFGHPLLMPIPDIDRTEYFLILGANPLASNGSLMTAPDIINRLENIKKRAGKIVLIDPRRTETARVASEHHFIKPSSDVYFLLAIVHTFFAEHLVNLERLAEFTDGVELLKEISTDYAPETVEELTEISASEIKRIAIEFAQAKSAVCYGRMGVSVQKFGSLCHWLINSINILTGNFDEAGGAMFTCARVRFIGDGKKREYF